MGILPGSVPIFYMGGETAQINCVLCTSRRRNVKRCAKTMFASQYILLIKINHYFCIDEPKDSSRLFGYFAQTSSESPPRNEQEQLKLPCCTTFYVELHYW